MGTENHRRYAAMAARVTGDGSRARAATPMARVAAIADQSGEQSMIAAASRARSGITVPGTNAPYRTPPRRRKNRERERAIHGRHRGSGLTTPGDAPRIEDD